MKVGVKPDVTYMHKTETLKKISRIRIFNVIGDKIRKFAPKNSISYYGRFDFPIFIGIDRVQTCYTQPKSWDQTAGRQKSRHGMHIPSNAN